MTEETPNRWQRPPWPWELEVLVVCCVVLAVLGPFLASAMSAAPDPAIAEAARSHSERVLASIQVRQDFLWSAFIIVLYAAHLGMALSTAEFITASTSHLLAPSFFAAVAYFRLVEFNKVYSFTSTFFHGRFVEFALLVGGVLLLTWYCARSRVVSHLRKFQGVNWQIVVDSHRDRSGIKLALLRIQPLFYVPRRFRACPEGLLIEGHSYLMPIPFHEIEHLYPVKSPQLFTPGLYLATSMRDLIGLKLFEKDEAVFISPANPTEFFRYCEKYVGRK